MTDAANPNPTPSPAPDEIHWGVAYLREDIQDVRQEWLITTMLAMTGILIAVIKL